jgi:hypothetical protein
MNGYLVKLSENQVPLAWFVTESKAVAWAVTIANPWINAQTASFSGELRPGWFGGYGVFPTAETPIVAWFSTAVGAINWARSNYGTASLVKDQSAEFSA